MAIITNILAFVLGAGIFMGAVFSVGILITKDLDRYKNTVINKILCTILSIAYLGGLLWLFYSYRWAVVPIFPADSVLGTVVSKAVAGLLGVTFILLAVSIIYGGIYGGISLLKIVFTSKKGDGTPRRRASRIAVAVFIGVIITGLYNYENIQKNFFQISYYEEKISEIDDGRGIPIYSDFDLAPIPFDVIFEIQTHQLSRKRDKGQSHLTDEYIDGLIDSFFVVQDHDVRWGKEKIEERIDLLSVARKFLIGKREGVFNSTLKALLQQAERERSILSVKLSIITQKELNLEQTTEMEISLIEAKVAPVLGLERKLLLRLNQAVIDRNLGHANIRIASIENYIESLNKLRL